MQKRIGEFPATYPNGTPETIVRRIDQVDWIPREDSRARATLAMDRQIDQHAARRGE